MLKYDSDTDSYNQEEEAIDTVRLNYKTRKSECFNQRFEIGNINYDTPISYFLKTFYYNDLSCYIYHKEIYFHDGQPHYIFILTDGVLITRQFEDETNTENYNYAEENPILMSIDYKNIYSFDYEITDAYCILILQVILNDSFSTYTNVKVSLKTIRDLLIICHLLKKQTVLAWQQFFETKLLPNSSHLYQTHFFLQKVNKRGKSQSRVILLTDNFIFNVSYKLIPSTNKAQQWDFDIEKQKWALAIESLQSIKISKKKPLALKVLLDKSQNKKCVEKSKLKLKNKGEFEFLFYSDEDFKNFIFQCRKLFFNIKKIYLTIALA